MAPQRNQQDLGDQRAIGDGIGWNQWCKERLNWTIERWGMVIFSDVSNFEVSNRKSRVLVKRLKKEKYDTIFVVATLQSGGGSAGILGCIRSKGAGCCRIYEGRIHQPTRKR
ncbi:TE: Transposable element Tcb1 [Brachionus plicatilis]|uniref:TE: Transposable element Tcb1 n=1 Tax=Brachionus plicatilis TaxID=10195 RepID=A0A3M7RGN2_BRAPC|nr:TE: Transposable element Tcb1 [Brachionus plicatilis]